jgi:hypothetical protein
MTNHNSSPLQIHIRPAQPDFDARGFVEQQVELNEPSRSSGPDAEHEGVVTRDNIHMSGSTMSVATAQGTNAIEIVDRKGHSYMSASAVATGPDGQEIAYYEATRPGGPDHPPTEVKIIRPNEPMHTLTSPAAKERVARFAERLAANNIGLARTQAQQGGKPNEK